MKIGIMLRTMAEKQGIGVYSQNLMDEMIAADTQNEYVLFYRDAEFLGRYARYPNVTEKLVRAPNKAIWDQIAIPREARREKIDLIFHTKFTVPLFTGRKTAMSVHGASWFVHPELYGKLDVAYIRTVMPLYCRKADAIVANSELTRQDYIRILGVNPAKIHTARLGVSPDFCVIGDRGRLEKVKEKYELPDQFILSVIKRDPRKNFGNLIEAFRLLQKRMAVKLVVVGTGCEEYISEYELDKDGTVDNMTFLGWMSHEELPVLYNLASCLFFPSVYEEFGIPTCEAMACGCPVVVSNTGALPEVAGDAGTIVDPFNPEEMADALEKIMSDGSLRETLAARGLERAKEFTWERCAKETLKILHEL